MKLKRKADIERIELIIEALMQVAQGDYSIQIGLSDKNDYIDALAMGFNTMVDDLKAGKLIEKENEEIKRLNIRLEEAKKAAEESNRLKSVFISNLSHEIRTPMNGIVGFANLLNDENLSAESRQNFTRIIINSSNQLLRIIDDILEISKLETKQVKVFNQEINLNDLMVELFNIFSLRAKENNVPVYLENGLPDTESFIQIDKSKLTKILSNLLENAFKYTHSGHIEFGYFIFGEEIEFYVKDTGIGISSELQESIFERFSQAVNNGGENANGLGLGLSIAKENTELLGGTIKLESEPGRGATFYVRLPYVPLKKEGVSYNQEHNFLEGKTTILIVEDEEVNYLFLKTLLKHLVGEVRILHASDGEEAINICKKNAEIDLIFMDIRLPVMDGLEATTRIKEFRFDIPIVAQSAFTSECDIENALAKGVSDYLTKPIKKKDLQSILEKYLFVGKE